MESRRLDAFLAVRLFGWSWWIHGAPPNTCARLIPPTFTAQEGPCSRFADAPPTGLPVIAAATPWSTTADGAEAVCNQIEARHEWDIKIERISGRPRPWMVWITDPIEFRAEMGFARADALPLAVAHAAIHALWPDSPAEARALLTETETVSSTARVSARTPE